MLHPLTTQLDFEMALRIGHLA